MTSPLAPRRLTITTALIYANGEIHLGHITSTYLPADIFTRYCRLKGYEVVHIGATDDFGTPILIRAEQEGTTPEQYVAHWNQEDQQDFAQLGISFDFYYRTSAPENIALTQYFFRRLSERGHIYQRPVLQPFCEFDRKFLPDRYVLGTCPYCGTPNQYSDGCERCGRTFEPGQIREPRCALCGRPPVQRESVHYFFRLSTFAPRLRAWLEGNGQLQPDVRNYVLRWIADGLHDWDITRDISWGVPIPLPEARGKVLYGWFDNHLGYIASTLAHFQRQGQDGKAYWNASEVLHFIGKDIVYHHYLFLPAMRLGADEEFKLPDAIPTRGHLTLEGQKFSKSRGWYIGLREFLAAYPPDYLRFYLALITPYSQDDVNFDWADFQARINTELVGNVGNFIHRVLSFLSRHFERRIPAPEPYDVADRAFVERMQGAPTRAGEALEAHHVDRALRQILEFSAAGNQYFQAKEPWRAPTRNPTCLYLGSNAVATLAVLLAPYLPVSMERLWGRLGLPGSVLHARWDSAATFQLAAGHTIAEPEILFRKIEDQEVTQKRAQLVAAVQRSAPKPVG